MFRTKVEEMKIIQKLRERPNGVNIIGLALGEKVTSDVATTVRAILYFKDIIQFPSKNTIFLSYFVFTE